MSVQWYAIQMEPQWLVAAEIGEWAAAIRLNEGRQVLLATVAELRRIARRLDRSLVTISLTASDARRSQAIGSPRAEFQAALMAPATAGAA